MLCGGVDSGGLVCGFMHGAGGRTSLHVVLLSPNMTAAAVAAAAAAAAAVQASWEHWACGLAWPVPHLYRHS
jgi:hypothetical protein